jgi:anhydro-N-acetylmuramic acid kinase
LAVPSQEIELNRAMRVIGLISGTSVDGIDAVLVEITGKETDLSLKLLAGATYPYPTALRERILEVCAGTALSPAELAALDDAIAIQFAQAAQKIQQGNPPADLIGSHGQTVYHRPPSEGGAEIPLGYSLQLGRGDAIALLTGIETVSNFRAADIAAGGHGAPMVSKIDACLLASPTQHRCIQNIGGIGNVTYLPARQGNWLEAVCGWDTGPGNALLDLAVQQFTEGRQTYDKEGSWAAQGTPCEALVEQWLKEEFFQAAPPKSTGRELFGVDYLHRCLNQCDDYQLERADILATLTELTVASIAHSYQHFLPRIPDEVFLGGGGSRNHYLKQRLQGRLASARVLTTDEAGMSGDFKEAIAFAVLAYWHRLGIPGNLPQVTGAKAAVKLGIAHSPPA